MPTKIRLQRRGKKGQAFYHIVIADGRAPRDGKFIEQIGIYNPITRPAEINIDFDKALDWLTKGAQPTDTVKAILAYKGVLYKNHLMKGVAKGAMTTAQAEAKFAAWLEEKNLKISGAKKEYELSLKDINKKRHAEEAKINEAKAAAIQAKLNKLRLDEAAQLAEARLQAEAAAAEAAAASVVADEVVAEAEVEAEVAPEAEAAPEVAAEAAPEETPEA